MREIAEERGLAGKMLLDNPTIEVVDDKDEQYVKILFDMIPIQR